MPSNNYGVDITPENLANGNLLVTLDPWAFQQTTHFQSGLVTNEPKGGSEPLPSGEKAPKPADQ